MNKTGVVCVSCGADCSDRPYADYSDSDGKNRAWCAHCYVEVIEGLLNQATESFMKHSNQRERLEWDNRLGQAIIQARQQLPWRKERHDEW